MGVGWWLNLFLGRLTIWFLLALPLLFVGFAVTAATEFASHFPNHI